MAAPNETDRFSSQLQNFEEKSAAIRRRYLAQKRSEPERFARRIDLSWSVWMFGIEPFSESVARLAKHGIGFIEMKGDHFTAESGLEAELVREVLADRGMRVSGTCGMFSAENDLSSNSAYVRQRAIDYVRREVDFLAEVGGHYLIVVPSAVGRPTGIDSAEGIRSATALRACGDDFAKARVAAAIEPIRSAEVSLVHTVDEACRYIEVVDHPGIGYVNADTYHMLLEEAHIAEAIVSCGERLANLHLADSNRNAPGTGMIDFDTVIMAAYLVGMNQEGRFLTAEPLGPITDPYLLGNEPCRTELMDVLVRETVGYVRAREEHVRSLTG